MTTRTTALATQQQLRSAGPGSDYLAAGGVEERGRAIAFPADGVQGPGVHALSIAGSGPGR